MGNDDYNSASLSRILQVDPTTLPVGLTSYFAKADGNRARLDWVTASEKDNNQFEIERSTDGRSFYKLGAVKGSGTTNGEKRYLFYD